MDYLIDNHELLDKQKEVIPEIPRSENWQYEVLRHFIGDTNTVVRIRLGDDTYVGFVNDCSEDATVLHCIGTEGHNEFFTLYRNNDIRTIRVNDIEARKRLILFNWRNNKV